VTVRIDLSPYRERIDRRPAVRMYGKIVESAGLTLVATGPQLHVGDQCTVIPRDVDKPIPVEVVGFRGGRILLMPLGDTHGIAPGNVVVPHYRPRLVPVGPELIGRVVNSLGEPIDGGPPIRCLHSRPLTATPPAAMERARIREPLATGIRAIDSCTTCGRGQRMGIFSGSGVGKSKLIGMVARNTNADVNVIALIGERGREVREFIENDLGPEGLSRSVVVVATSDEPALLRLNGAFAATAMAEYFRDEGADAILIMDSLTRFAMAQREIGLAVGEPPTTRGYPPSVYALLPKLLERAGTAAEGSITGIYAVLVEGDDFNDPVGDLVRSIIDGHVALSRRLASRGHYPAVDVLESVSRCMPEVTDATHQQLATRLRQVLATYREAEDLVNIGAYVQGSNPEIDFALRIMPRIEAFLKQGVDEGSPYGDVVPTLQQTLQG